MVAIAFARAFADAQPLRYAADSPDHAAFHAAIRRSPANDALPALVYADWLDENNHPAYAEVVRRDQQRQQGTLMSPDPYRDPGLSVNGNATKTGYSVSVGFTDPETRSRTWHSVHTSPDDAHRIVRGLEAEGIHGAAIVRQYMEDRFPHLASTES